MYHWIDSRNISGSKNLQALNLISKTSNHLFRSRFDLNHFNRLPVIKEEGGNAEEDETDLQQNLLRSVFQNHYRGRKGTQMKDSIDIKNFERILASKSITKLPPLASINCLMGNSVKDTEQVWETQFGKCLMNTKNSEDLNSSGVKAPLTNDTKEECGDYQSLKFLPSKKSGQEQNSKNVAADKAEVGHTRRNRKLKNSQNLGKKFSQEKPQTEKLSEGSLSSKSSFSKSQLVAGNTQSTPDNHSSDINSKNAMKISSSERFSNVMKISSSERFSNVMKISSSERFSNVKKINSSERFSNVMKINSSERFSNVMKINSSERFSNVMKINSSERFSNVMKINSSERFSNVMKINSSERFSNVMKIHSSERFSNVIKNNSSERFSNVIKISSIERFSNAEESSRQKKHLENKKEGCHICEKQFSDPQQYAQHLLTHEVVDKFTCKICKIHFLSLRKYKQHCRDFHFTLSSVIKKQCFDHEPKPTPKFECKRCKATFEMEQNFEAHKKIHSEKDSTEKCHSSSKNS